MVPWRCIVICAGRQKGSLDQNASASAPSPEDINPFFAGTGVGTRLLGLGGATASAPFSMALSSSMAAAWDCGDHAMTFNTIGLPVNGCVSSLV